MKITQAVFWELVLFKALAGLRAESARYYLGLLWWLVEPVLFMLVFVFVFGILLETGPDDFVAFLLVGLVCWQWFGNTVQHAMSAILEGGALMDQVHLPKLFFPAVVIVMDAAKFGFVLSMLLVFLYVCGFAPDIHWLALPLVLLLQLLFITGVALLAAALVPLLPDLRFIIAAALQLLFFVSGIFFSGDTIATDYQSIFYANPMAVLIESWRDLLMHGHWPDVGRLVWIGLLASLLLGMASLLLARLDQIYPRVVVR